MPEIEYAAEMAKLSDAKLAKKIRHLRRTLRRGLEASTFARIAAFHEIACVEAESRLAARASSPSPER